MRSYLNECQRIESMMGEVYRKLARVPRYSDRLRTLFDRLARDEEDHARELALAKGLPEEIFFAGPALSSDRLDQLSRRAFQFRKLADAPPASETKILEVARELEREFIELHLRNAVRFRDERLGRLFDGLARDDQEHLAELEDFFTAPASREKH
jgi:rubrerythrin